jgi:hypothetical protein
MMLVYFTAIWSILRPFGIFCGHLVNGSRFGMFNQENLATPELGCHGSGYAEQPMLPFTDDATFFRGRKSSTSKQLLWLWIYNNRLISVRGHLARTALIRHRRKKIPPWKFCRQVDKTVSTLSILRTYVRTFCIQLRRCIEIPRSYLGR